jgi:hypothetical protein
MMKKKGTKLLGDARRWPERTVVFDEGVKAAAYLPTWVPGGGVVLAVHPVRQDWQLPADAIQLPSFHVTLIGRKPFREQQDMMAKIWEAVRTSLPLPPEPELETAVNQAIKDDRKTWFLPIINQDEFRSYVEKLTRILDDAFSRLIGHDLTHLETDRYFHVSIANNQNGDPFKSIGSIRRPSKEL